MAKQKLHSKAEVKKRALALLSAAESILLESVTRAAGFEDAEDFKKAVIRDLEAYQPFDRAARDFHSNHVAAKQDLAATGKVKDEWKGQPKRSGRIQAARYEPGSKGKKKSN